MISHQYVNEQLIQFCDLLCLFVDTGGGGCRNLWLTILYDRHRGWLGGRLFGLLASWDERHV